jgi:hypothetical protein
MCVLFCLLCLSSAQAEERTLAGKLHHLRVGNVREWSEFPDKAEADGLTIKFAATQNAAAQTLRIRQQDVKQTWQVVLNGKRLGRLFRNENDMVIFFAVPPRALVNGENELKIEQSGTRPDDVRIGEITLDSRPMQTVLGVATVSATIFDKTTGKPIPGRITILDADGALHSVGAESNETLAVRPGVVYTSNGRATFGLPAGRYTIFAGRGFEYGIDSRQISLKAGQTTDVKLSIAREVPTAGWVSCDTHVHTLTHSGHGDATISERLIVLAGEGIELPIATDHNIHIDYNSLAKKMGVRKYFTPVIGNEVTTKTGHFNIFPVQAGAAIPDYKRTDWKSILKGIYATPGVKVAILNHARDAHSGVTPFGPKLHNAVIGENVSDWPTGLNAMELINSGAQQTDMMRLYRDWFGMLNRGRYLTPVGSSDSHDVARHFVGQGRTYIRCNDEDVGNIDVDQAVAAFVAGRVMVSLGLLAEITVDEKYGPGDLVPKVGGGQQTLDVHIRVLGPSWSKADRVTLYVNGRKIREEKIPAGAKPGVQWDAHWTLTRPQHDVHLVAVASGPGVRELYWPIAKPYQPTSPNWEPRCVGSSGAVWIDGDGDGHRNCAYDYADRIVKSEEARLPGVLKALANYDEAVAAQAAGLLDRRGVSLQQKNVQQSLKSAAPQVRDGFAAYLRAWRETQIARSRSK